MAGCADDGRLTMTPIVHEMCQVKGGKKVPVSSEVLINFNVKILGCL